MALQERIHGEIGRDTSPFGCWSRMRLRFVCLARRDALGVRRFAVYAEEDGRSLRFETDERYCTGKGRGFAGAYLC